jgi:Beta-lactamase
LGEVTPIQQVESVRDQLDAVVATGVPGAVAIAVGPDGRVEAGAGVADVRTGEALTVEHRFRIGSVTKIFVAALVLRLVAEGLLDLDDDAAGEIAKMFRVQLRDEFLPDHLRAEMLRAVESDWAETNRYGLGIGEITALMGRERSPCGAAWGHIGFAVGYTAFGLSSEDGERQVVICANGSPSTPSTEEAFFDAAGRLAWQLYCI